MSLPLLFWRQSYPAAATATPSGFTQGGAGFSAQDPMSMSEAAGPLGLNNIILPRDGDSIIALFDRLPSTPLGWHRADEIQAPSPARINASYPKTQMRECSTVGLQALDISSGDFFPAGWTSERVIAIFTLGADWTVEGFGRDGELFWVKWHTTCSAGPSLQDSLHVTTWGNRGSPWVFSATAPDAEGRDELVAAFVASSGFTP